MTHKVTKKPGADVDESTAQPSTDTDATDANLDTLRRNMGIEDDEAPIISGMIDSDEDVDDGSDSDDESA